MAIIKSFSPFQNLSNFQTFLVDENPLSNYFRITEFKDTFTGGKNGFLIEGSEFLKETTEVKIELLDVEGNPIYFEPGDGIPEYYEGTSKLVSIHVYDDTPIGLGKITILGELKNYVDDNGSVIPVPSEWKGVYNVKWERTFKVNKNLSNEDIVRFYKRPLVNIDELVKPIFTKSVNQVTDTGEVTGVAQLPNTGTNLSTYRGGTFYKLIKSSGTWDIDVDENTIDVTVDGSLYSPKIIEVLNDREVLVDIPYTDNSIVGNFVSQSYSVTYTDFQNETIGESALTGSFAKIDITQLKTFVGDVARVKVFRKSRSSANDFQFVQESRLESTELLRDITTTENTELSYGRFDQSNLEKYWVTTSIDHTTEIDSSILSQAVKVDYDTNQGGVQKLITSQSFSISKDVEYTLNFRTLLSGSISDDKYLKAYFSGSYENGSPFTQSFVDVTPDGSYVVRKNITENVISQQDVDAKLVFEFKGDDWYISNVSLRNAQDTSFSPDEFTLIQDIPRKLASETFDFRFEFYDINNNYIPVNVVATKTFNGGNDFNTTSKLLTFESDRNAFRYISGSGNPESQQIQFKTTIQNLTGSVAYFSSAFDEDGVYIEPTDWVSYPGGLTNPSNNGGLVTIGSFEGTWGGVDPKPEVFSVIYTASIEELEEFETIYRLEDGENAPTLLVSSNANQFIYEPTTLSPKPSGQSITVRAQRKNLASIDTPITINKSNVNGPDLVEVSTESGVTTYTLSALQFSASFAQNNFDEITYEFTGSDVFGVEQSDEITLSKVVNFDGVSVILSNESTSLPANSLGFVSSSDFVLTSGSATVYVAGNLIPFDDNGGKNTFEITNLQGTNCTPNGSNGSDPTTNQYGITSISNDQAQLDVTVTYTAGDGVTSQSFAKGVSYTRVKSSPPSLRIEVTNDKQTVEALSTGVQTGSFLNSVATVFEEYRGVQKELPLNDLGVGSPNFPSPVAVNLNTGEIFFSNTTNWGYETAQVTVNAFVTDSEGANHEIRGSVSLNKVRRPKPNTLVTVSPQSQTVDSGSAADDIVISVKEGASDYSYGTAPLSENEFEITSLSSGFSNSTSTITLDSNPTLTTSGTATISYINSEGTAGSEDVLFSIGVAKQGKDGSGAANIEFFPQTQQLIIDVDGVYTPNPPSEVTVSVIQGGSEFTYIEYDGISISSTLSSDSTYTLTNATLCSYTTAGNVQPNSPSANLPYTISFDVTYKDQDGNVSDTITKSHYISIVADGSTGPGIVFTGPWENDRTYQYDLSNGRRDAVLYDGVYYATLASNTNVAPDTPGQTVWQDLGTDDFFVAAKIAIFQDSFIQNTLNIGANNEGSLSSANITLNGGDEYPYFSLGQSASTGSQQYSAGNGIFIGRDANDGGYKMSLENGTDSYLKWTGTELLIKGGITATSIAFNTGVTINESNIDGLGDLATENLVTETFIDNYSISTPKLKTNAIQGGSYSYTAGETYSNQGSIFDLANGNIITPNFSVIDGNANFAGTLAAGTIMTNGTISGGIIDGTTFTGATGTFSGNITSDTGNIGGWTIEDNKIFTPIMALNSNRPALEIYSGNSLAVDINSNTTLSSLTGGSNSTNINAGVGQDTAFANNFGWSSQYTVTGLTLEATATAASSLSTAGLANQTLTFTYDSVDNTNIIQNQLDLENLQDPTSQYYQEVGSATNNIHVVLELVDSGGNVAASISAFEFSLPELPLLQSTQGETSVTLTSSHNPDLGPKSTSFIASGGTYTVRTRTYQTTSFQFFASSYAPKAYSTQISITALTAGFSNIRVFKDVSKSELNAGGMQVVRSTTEYVIMDRLSSGTMLQVGGNITATGNITAYYSSDSRLKENIIPIVNPFDKIDKIGGYEFDWKPEFKEIHNSNGHDVGLIAQEIQKSMPELVGEMNGGFLGVKYEKLTVYLLEAVKNLNNRLIELEDENNKLKEGN